MKTLYYVIDNDDYLESKYVSVYLIEDNEIKDSLFELTVKFGENTEQAIHDHLAVWDDSYYKLYNNCKLKQL